jgi:hypothetical protein
MEIDLRSLIIGVLAASFGFVLTMLWDLWKSHREESRRTVAILRAIEAELKENIEIAKFNTIHLEIEMRALNDRESTVIGATVPFKHGILDLLKINLPEKLLERESLLSMLSNITIAVWRLNHGMLNRQTYHDANMTTTNLHQNMKLWNMTLLGQLKKLPDIVEDALKELKQLNSQ